MKKTWCCLFLVFLAVFSATSQSISRSWQLQSEIESQEKEPFFPLGAVLDLEEGQFKISHSDSGEVLAEGDYLYQNNLLVFFFNTPRDSISNLRVSTLTDTSMVLSGKGKVWSFSENLSGTTEILPAKTIQKIIPNQGISPESILRGAIGMALLLLIAFIFSTNRRKINWRTIGAGLGAQLLLAIGVLKITLVQRVFEFIGGIFVLILDFTAAGSEFLLGDMMDVDSFGFIFLFQVLPTIIFFSALTSVLFYLGVIQIVVKGMAWVLTKLMGISGAESLSVAGNIFLGQTEAPLMIKAYLERMTRSEILLVMVGGMATVAGGVLAAYIGFLGGDDPELRLQFAKHLLAASVMAAPGAIVVSKILYPQQEAIDSNVAVSAEKIGSNILDSIANGTTEGLRLAANVGAMLLVFIAFIAMINHMLNWTGTWTGINQILAEHTPYSGFSLESILGILFAPLMWAIGVAREDMMLMGQLLGIKLAASEFVGYVQLSELKNPASVLSLTYEKSVIMATYMLCGFANFASIGIQIGGIGSLAPGQRRTLSEFGMKALIGGTIASLLSATIAGMLLG